MDVILSHFNLDSPIPTFFELYAQERITPALMAAYRYFMSLLAQRTPRLERFVPYLDESFLLLWGAIDASFLKLYDATFTENFFNFKRSRVLATESAPATDELEEAVMKVRLGPLQRGDRLYSFLTALVIPYFRTKAESFLRRSRRARGPRCGSSTAKKGSGDLPLLVPFCECSL